MRVLLLLGLLIGACGTDAPEAPIVAIAPGTPSPNTSPAVLPPTPMPSTAPPCVVGRWEANDFLAALRQQVRSDLQDARLTRASGTITFDLGALDPTGAGQLVATANDLEHRATVGRGGLRADLTHRLTGGATMGYRLPLEGQMLILPPTEGELSATVRWSVRVGKARRGRQESVAEPFALTGLYAYECVADRMTIRRIEGPGQFGDMLTLDRTSLTP